MTGIAEQTQAVERRRRKVVPPPPADGAAILDEIEAVLRRYVIFPNDHAVIATTLWIAATHGQQAWEAASRLVIKSPIRGCGKSRLMDLISGLGYKPLLTMNISAAALVRMIDEQDPYTLLLDEADAIFGGKQADNHEDLRGLLNAGFQRNRPYIRWNMTTRQPENCQSFSMAATAGIGKMPDTIEDRAVIINLSRRPPGEEVARFRPVRDIPLLKPLGDRTNAWVRAHLKELQAATPSLPVEDRAADVWEPLIAVADLAGGDWPKRGRQAALAMCKDTSDEDHVVLLLNHIHKAFKENGSGKLTSEELIEFLFSQPDGPWASWWGRNVTWDSNRACKDYRSVASRLASMLRPFRITSRNIRTEDGVKKGYEESDFSDTWERLRIEVATPATEVTPQVRRPIKKLRSRYSNATRA